MENLSVYNPEGSDLRRAQHVMQFILDTVSDLFDREGIPYWLSFGTALGACRHGGFIPWDDDLDISVPYSYKQRVVNLLKTELTNGLIVHSKENDPNYPWSFVKVRDTHSILYEPGNAGYRYKGIFIDIFFVKPTTFHTHQWRYNLLCKRTVWQKNYFQSGKVYYLNKLFYTEKLLILLSLLDKWLIKRYYYTEHFEEVIDSRKDIFPLTTMQFEGKEYKVPGNMKAYLEANYDDYEKIPEPHERFIHSVKYEFLEK